MTNYEDDFPIEQVPKMRSFGCKIAAQSIYWLIKATPFVTALFVYWLEHSLWIAFLFGLFSLLALGVVISKMRIRSIPFNQREINYTTMEVVRWYLGKNICIQGDNSVS